MWFVYIIECHDGSLYTGITTDLMMRIKKHQLGKGAKYTRGRGPVKLRASLKVDTRSMALQIESFIKKCPKKLKVRALELMNTIKDA
jgi:putative endonuclease